MCISKSRRKNSSTVELIASFSHFLRDFIGNSKVFPAFLEPSTNHCKKKVSNLVLRKWEALLKASDDYPT